MTPLSRRGFLQGLAAGGATVAATHIATPAVAQGEGVAAVAGTCPYRLGMVTYNMGKDMRLSKLLRFCEETGLEGVELRTTHAHGVEPSLSASERVEIKARFADSLVALAGLGTANDFHAKDPAEVRRNIEECKAFIQLAADVGAPGIKVRPNGLFEDEPIEQTCERIGKGWRETAQFGAEHGVEVRMEVHGGGGARDPKNIRKMLDYADHDNAKVCWNSNSGEEDESGSIKANFDLLKHAITLVHITDIGVYQYPWQELFDLLREENYSGFCLAEIQFNPEPERFMKYYRTLFDLYTRQYQYPRAHD